MIRYSHSNKCYVQKSDRQEIYIKIPSHLVNFNLNVSFGKGDIFYSFGQKKRQTNIFEFLLMKEDLKRIYK